MTLTLTDFFCGAGGSSQGLAAVPGVEVRLAANHWDLAVSTHAANFPAVDHDCADISQVDFRRYPATDLLWASPECTNHSMAKGQRRADAQPDLFGEVLPGAAAERSRATMWDVPRYLETMLLRGRSVSGGVVENVVDARRWLMWDAWILALRSLGYDTQVVYLNSMFAHAATTPWAPQSRDRMYVLYWRQNLGRRPDVDKWTRPYATCGEHGQVRAVQAWKRPETPWGRYRAQYLYRCPVVGCWVEVDPHALPAATAIDWTDLGERIGDRTKPLAAKTLARIQAGLASYGPAITLEAAGNTFERRPGVRTWPVDAPLTTQTTTPTKALALDALVVPVEGRDGKEARPAHVPLRTQTARLETGIATRMASAHRGLLVPAGGTRNDTATSTGEPMRTRTTRESEALVVPYYGTGKAQPASEPVGTVTTRDRHALVTSAPYVEDCHFRMLQPDEISAAMAFAQGYTVLGTRREQVRQLGNAVTPPAAEVLASALVEAITGEPARAA